MLLPLTPAYAGNTCCLPEDGHQASFNPRSRGEYVYCLPGYRRFPEPLLRSPRGFGICPWRREIVQGLLGSSILGLHTRYHCKNFLETVDRYLEARIEHEHSSVTYRGEETRVESYPISIEWPTPQVVGAWPSVAACRETVLHRFGLASDVCLAVGVDRFDYTKGILERLHAVERLLEKRPEWVGRFVLIQVAAPTRSALEEYRSFHERIERVTQRINSRFGRPGCVQADPADWEESFFSSRFSHPNIHEQNLLVKYRGGSAKFWNAMLKGKFKAFPLDTLVPTELTVRDVLAQIGRDV